MILVCTIGMYKEKGYKLAVAALMSLNVTLFILGLIKRVAFNQYELCINLKYDCIFVFHPNLRFMLIHISTNNCQLPSFVGIYTV